MSAQAPLLVRIRPRWLQLRNQQALLLPGRSVGHIFILSQTFNHIESTFRDLGSNVGIVALTLGGRTGRSWPRLCYSEAHFSRPASQTQFSEQVYSKGIQLWHTQSCTPVRSNRLRLRPKRIVNRPPAAPIKACVSQTPSGPIDS